MKKANSMLSLLSGLLMVAPVVMAQNNPAGGSAQTPAAQTPTQNSDVKSDVKDIKQDKASLKDAKEDYKSKVASIDKEEKEALANAKTPADKKEVKKKFKQEREDARKHYKEVSENIRKDMRHDRHEMHHDMKGK